MVGNKKEIIDWLLDKDKEVVFEIKEKKKKRSLNANSYCWVLLQKLAEVLNTTKEELYVEYIKELGIFKTVEIQNNAVSTITYCWNNMGLGFVYDIIDSNEKSTNLILYYGSSTYNTKQMARLIDEIYQDCIENNIDVIKPDELERLKNEWKK